jgi:hypothetical protein
VPATGGGQTGARPPANRKNKVHTSEWVRKIWPSQAMREVSWLARVRQPTISFHIPPPIPFTSRAPWPPPVVAAVVAVVAQGKWGGPARAFGGLVKRTLGSGQIAGAAAAVSQVQPAAGRTNKWS